MDLLSLSLANIGRRKFRNGFTVVSVSIGIAAIISLLALGDGMKAALNTQLGPMAADVIVMAKAKGVQRERGWPEMHGPPGGGPGGPGGSGVVKPLSEATLEDILRRVNGIRFAVPRYSAQAKLLVSDTNYTVSVMGVDPEAERLYGQLPKFSEGKMFLARDRHLVVVGSRVVERYFKFRRPHVGTTLVIGGRKYQVSGILAQGGQGGPGGGSYDGSVVMTLDDARELGQPDVSDQLSQITLRAVSTDAAKQVASDVQAKIDTVQTMALESMLETIQSVMDTFAAFLAGIAGISLFVAAITILNNMYTSVMERRREIGTMKALGMTSAQVLTSFSIEAALLGFLGGVLGVLMGLGIGRLVESLKLGSMGPGNASLVPVYSPVYMAVAVAFGVLVALVSGLYPAWRASKLSPVEALSYE